MASSSSSSSSDVPRKRWTYDVFLNFRGADTRNFVEHLYAALQRNGIQTFEDDKTLGGSQPISEELVKAIKESRFVVVVFSNNYAYSWWCLEELSTIMEFHKQIGGPKILPVFYKVNPDNVHNQTREIATAFEIYEERFRGEVDKVKKWRNALIAATKLYGLDIGYKDESAFINTIVQVILADKQPRGGIKPRIDPLYSSSVVPTIKGRWKYDVYLSFRGEDTRNNFVDHLCAALQRTGILTFKELVKDDEMQPISEDVVKAIKESRFAVVVFTENYTNSSLCLEEISTIMECHDQMYQKVLPVFYHVDPSDICVQEEGELDKVKKWRDALTAAAKLYGLRFLPDNMGESAFINKIVEVILADIEPWIDPLYSSSVVRTRKGGWKYDVFLSFRGEDTRNNFVDHLYAALVQEGIRVFKGDEMQPISEDVVKAIKESGFAVVVFSKNYTSSSLCLEEISTIMECHDQMGQKVFPVFYHVDPSDICVQVEGEVDKVKKWRDALTAATNLPKLHISPNNTDDSASITTIVETIRNGVQIGKLFVSFKEICKGSNDTIVLEGTYDDTRPAAVKRIVKEHHHVDSKEIRNLFAHGRHSNVVEYYGVGYDQDFVYIAMERCICSLQDLILPPTNPTVQSLLTLSEVESFKVREPIGYPSPELLKVMRDTVAGLAHLHKLGFIDRNLQPQNVLICKDGSITAKVSLTIAAGYGSPGWQAPELFHEEPQITNAVDLFSLGCLLFFCITGGRHPFGDDMDECDKNIVMDRKDLSLVDNIPEAFDLVSNLIHPDPESRPIAAEVYHHPLFWDPDTRLSFLRDASDRVELEARMPGSILLNALESIGTVAFGSKWDGELDITLLDDLKTGRHRKYEFDKVRDLLLVIRNKFNRYRDLRKDVQDVLGDVPTGFEGYFRSRFPKLLMEVYKVLKQYCREEESLKKYYKKRVEAEHVSKIVQQISADIQPRGATRENHLVGIEPHIDALISLLKMEATKDVRIVGIWGVRGIGKTTIALALFDRIAQKFEGSSFVANVRENSSTEKDICGLQQKILEDIPGEHHGYMIKDRDQGGAIIQERCHRKKVLLVLDDVNDVMQSEFLAASPEEWFGPGSRIIITTRDQHLLSYADEKYKPATLSGDQAVELFNWHAFNKTSPREGYEELSIRAVRSTGGLPLALEILGSLLLGRPSDVWESALDRLVEIPIEEIYDTPELCFNVVETKKGRWTYDVFLSFRGRDTLHSFVESLYAELVWNGIRVFKDNEMLGGGQTILEEHVKAIKESRFAVVVFSKNYANSSLCLEELSTIMECHDQMGGLKVLPVFYHVDPSDVRNQKRDFAVAFETHEHKFKGEMNKVHKWRDAVTAAANLDGQQHISPGNGGEYAIRSTLVEQISADTQSHGDSGEQHLIGREPQTGALNKSTVQKREGRRTHDVFLSFYTMDTGNNFSDHLYAALDRERISVFRHFVGQTITEDVEQTISEDVEKAIKESGFAIVVFSENYARSPLCRAELSKIMECHGQNNQRVLLVFYHVVPEVFRRQRTERFFIDATNLLDHQHIPRDNEGESRFVKNIVQKILNDAERCERKFQKLIVSEEEIGKGSNGTIVLKGTYQTRRAAVKRILKNNHNDNALKEILESSHSDHHHNIVRYYCVEDHETFIDIALELCICSLHELMILPSTEPKLPLTEDEMKSFKKGEATEYPSLELLKVLRDTVAGLAHLHKLGFIHRDLKPQNVLICKYGSIRGKVSEMAIGKRLPAEGTTGYGSPGWQAPETLLNQPQITQITNAVDLFSFGCLLFFCITGGRHPFGDNMVECDKKIKEEYIVEGLKNISLVENIPEAFDLVPKLINREPKSRPSAAEVYHHPLFWDPETRLSFFRDASDFVELEYCLPNSVLRTPLESIGTVVFGSKWDDKLDSNLLNELKNRRKYKDTSVQDLLRFIRNILSHYRERSPGVKAVLGDVPRGLEEYFRKKFPKLLIEVYKVLKQHCENEASLKKYF